MTSHVFTEATHVVSAPCGFACAVTHATYLYIPSFIEIRLGAFEPQQVEICPFPFLWLLAFTTSCLHYRSRCDKNCKTLLPN